MICENKKKANYTKNIYIKKTNEIKEKKPKIFKWKFSQNMNSGSSSSGHPNIK